MSPWILALACAQPPAPSPDPQAVVASVAERVSEPAPTPIPAPEPAVPLYSASVSPLSQEIMEKMRAAGSWSPGCPVPLESLSLLTLTHHAPLDEVREGRLIVATAYAEPLKQVFGELFEAGFVIEKMQPAYTYGASDDAMMADNNTSAFNCRPVTGGSAYSEHSYGHALDLNPLWNPYVRGSVVQPPHGRAYLDRQAGLPGMVVAGGPAVRALQSIGWGWGGSWKNFKDYQHFSATGR